MRTLALLSLLSLSLTATADSHVDGWLGSVDTVVLDKAVEVPLYTTPGGGPRPCVMVTIGDKPYLLAIEPGSNLLVLGDRVASEQELKVKSHNHRALNLQGEAGKWRAGGEIKTVSVDSIKIGDLELKDVDALAAVPTGSDNSDVDSFMRAPRGNVDGVIGMGALPGVAVAILPSKGVIRFVPVAEGAALVDGLGGSKLSYTTAPSRDLKFGKGKLVDFGAEIVVPAKIDGVDAQAILTYTAPASAISTALALPDSAPVASRGDLRFAHVDLQVGDQKASRWAKLDSGWELMAELDSTRFPHDALFGLPFLLSYDLAVDPGTHTLALSPVEELQRDRPDKTLAEAADAALKESIEKAKEGGDDAKKDDAKKDDAKKDDAKSDDADKPEGDKGSWQRIADLRAARADFAGAAEALEKVAMFDEEACDGWMNLGRMQRKAKDLDAALVSFQKADDASQTWWGLPVDERLGYVKRQDSEKATGLGKIGHILWGWTYPAVPEDLQAQAASCHTVVADLAGAYLAKGEYDKVEQLYRERLDLDPHLADVYGNALVIQGEYAKANEPYRQAILRETSPQTYSRVGLAEAYALGGDWDTASGHFAKALETMPGNPMVTTLWLDALREAQGQDAALKAARERVVAMPGNLGALLGLVHEATLAGDQKSLSKATKQADKLFERRLRVLPNSHRLHALHVRYLVMLGDLDGAKAELDVTKKLNHSDPLVCWAGSDYMAATGDMDHAKMALQKATELAPFCVGFQILSSKLQAPAPEPTPAEEAPAAE